MLQKSGSEKLKNITIRKHGAVFTLSFHLLLLNATEKHLQQGLWILIFIGNQFSQVDTLKDRLDEKHKELVKMQESNQDLKSRLQTVGREKDISQVRLHTASL